jgi:hypothetical protein
VFFFLFAVLWCLAITVGTDRSIETLDAVAYRQQFDFFLNTDYMYFRELISSYFSFTFKESSNKDIYSTLVIYGITRLTDNYHVMFMVFGAVCSFFMLKTFRFFTGERAFNNSFSAFLLAVMFVMHNDIWNIWGVRFITATWIALYATFQILRNENKKYLLLLCVTPLIHASFFIYIALFTTAFFIHKTDTTWRVIFVLSMVVSTFSVYFVSQVINILPPRLQGAFSGYIEESYIYSMQNDFESRIVIFQILIIGERLFTIMFVLFIMLNRKIIIYKQDYRIYILLLIVTSFASFTSVIPSLGERFFRLTYPLIAYLFMKYFNYGKFRILLYIYPFVFLFHFAKNIGVQYWRTTSLDFYLLSPFYTIYKYIIAA